ncbi:hypothetical protein F4680DRAFT_442893 [Xylaria scruposa]|nr:hypothetical protein F4680DRAFT_442893 [Xylaria scruposa]
MAPPFLSLNQDHVLEMWCLPRSLFLGTLFTFVVFLLLVSLGCRFNGSRLTLGLDIWLDKFRRLLIGDGCVVLINLVIKSLTAYTSQNSAYMVKVDDLNYEYAGKRLVLMELVVNMMLDKFNYMSKEHTNEVPSQLRRHHWQQLRVLKLSLRSSLSNSLSVTIPLQILPYSSGSPSLPLWPPRYKPPPLFTLLPSPAIPIDLAEETAREEEQEEREIGGPEEQEQEEPPSLLPTRTMRESHRVAAKTLLLRRLCSRARLLVAASAASETTINVPEHALGPARHLSNVLITAPYDKSNNDDDEPLHGPTREICNTVRLARAGVCNALNARPESFTTCVRANAPENRPSLLPARPRYRTRPRATFTSVTDEEEEDNDGFAWRMSPSFHVLSLCLRLALFHFLHGRQIWCEGMPN